MDDDLRSLASEAELAAFEAAHGVRLPPAYRRYLGEVANGGTRDGVELFPLGRIVHGEPCPPLVLEALRVPFDAGRAESWRPRADESEASWARPMRGALPVGHGGCQTWYWLVVSGPERGEVWLDERGDGEPPEPVVGEDGALEFDAWLRSLDALGERFPESTVTRFDARLRAVVEALGALVDAERVPVERIDDEAFLRSGATHAFQRLRDGELFAVYLDASGRPRWFEVTEETLAMLRAGEIAGFDTYPFDD
ncbi:MAG: SMI1/KNR4 family protein [Sandaracinaceae bacterium]